MKKTWTELLWPEVIEKIITRRPLISTWVECAIPIPCNVLTLAFSKSQAISVESLSRPNNLKLLEECVGEVLGGNWKVKLELRDDI